VWGGCGRPTTHSRAHSTPRGWECVAGDRARLGYKRTLPLCRYHPPLCLYHILTGSGRLLPRLLLLQDFPYHLQPGTVHLNLWANRPLSCGEVAAHIAERVGGCDWGRRGLLEVG
jgi:hypothetical protein